jgi:ABC-type transporter Mla subunit MlaD
MELVADGLLISAAIVAALYCHVLSRRLRRLGDLDTGLGGAVATLSRQAEDLRAAIDEATESTRELAKRTARADSAAGRLEILIAAMHDAESRARPPGLRAVPSSRVAVVGDDHDDAVEGHVDPAPQRDEADEPGDGLASAIRALAGRGRS